MTELREEKICLARESKDRKFGGFIESSMILEHWEKLYLLTHVNAQIEPLAYLAFGHESY